MATRFSSIKASLMLLRRGQVSPKARVAFAAALGIASATVFAACSDTAGPDESSENASPATASAAVAPSGPIRGTKVKGIRINTHPNRRVDVVSLDVRLDGDGDGLVNGIPASSYVDWHTHPGPTVVIVTGGTLTMNHAKSCEKGLFAPGSVFLAPEHVHLASNDSGTDIVLRATFFLPEGAPPTVLMPPEFTACGL